MRIASVFLFLFLISAAPSRAGEQAQSTGTPPPGMRGRPVNLPDISAVVTVDGHASDDRDDRDRNKLFLDEAELAFQGFLYPEIRADVIVAIEKHGGAYETEIEEGKIGFKRLAEGLAAEAGKVFLGVGKLNRLHSHHRSMIDQPKPMEDFLGEHALAGHGASLSYLLPLPFFLQVEGGAWRVLSEHEEDAFTLDDEVYTGRAHLSFAPTAKTELELGSSLAKGFGSHRLEHKDLATIIGGDLTFRAWPSSYSRWTFQNEWFYLSRKVEDGSLYRNGLYSYLLYRFNKYWEAGGRFDYSEGAFPEQSIERSFSTIGGYHLTETATVHLQHKLRSTGGRRITEGWLRLCFGIGPHSHELE